MSETIDWVSVDSAWLPSGWVKQVSVAVDSTGLVIAVEVGQPPRSSVQNGLLLPGLINAHTHLEQGWRTGCVPGGEGFVRWAQGLMSDKAPQEVNSRLLASARAMKADGCAAVSDIAGSLDTLPLWAQVGMQGVVQREFLGFERETLSARILVATETKSRVEGLMWERPTAHAPYSTPPELMRATLGHASRGPASIHLAEDSEEGVFLSSGEGKFAAFLDGLGIDWRWFEPPGLSGVGYLDALGLLGPGLLAVHGVHLSGLDRATLASSNTPLCLCPRSNLHIGGQLPDVVGLLQAGVSLCLGTDSLASSPDVDVLAEIPVLAAAFPSVPVEVWVGLCTADGAAALGLESLGRIAPGSRPGLLLLDGCPSIHALSESVAYARRWLVEPGIRA